ncbi:hypothetical protein BJ912DRAFT_855611, partial [Pholiota molesta]
EILQEIFIHCLPRDPLLQRQPSSTTAPILLCHICSSWRQLHQASAILWAHRSISFPRRSDTTPLLWPRLPAI